MAVKMMQGAKLLKTDDSAGTATIAFAQLNVVDHDNDYTLPGAFEVGQKAKVCQYGHAHGALPAGVGVIVGEQEIDGGIWAVAELKFFLDTPQGDATYKTVKALEEAGHTQEWSYGYDTLAASPMEIDGQYVNGLQKQSVFEFSPVLRGAGIGTRTLAVKAHKDAEDDGDVMFPCPACGVSLVVETEVQDEAEDAAAGKALDPVTCPDCGAPVADCACGDALSVQKGRSNELLLRFVESRANALDALTE